MKTYDLQGIELAVPPNKALAFIGDPHKLPDWTDAFASVDGAKAVMRTPAGEVEIDLEVLTSAPQGTVDWRMVFPDGSVATAFSRVVANSPESCVLSFVLTPPPVPLEQLEGTIEAQSRVLAGELKRLKRLLEAVE